MDTINVGINENDDAYQGLSMRLISFLYTISFDVVKYFSLILLLKAILNMIYLEMKRQRSNRFYAEQGVAQPVTDPVMGFVKERLHPKNKNRVHEFFLSKLDEIPNARLYFLRSAVFDDEPKLWSRDPGKRLLFPFVSSSFYISI